MRGGPQTREQRGIGQRADRDHQAIDPAAQHRVAMLGHCGLARHFRHQHRAAREQIVERFDHVDPAEPRARRLAAAGSRECADDRHAVRRACMQRRQHVLRDPAASDEADRRHCKDAAATISGIWPRLLRRFIAD
jgi:hypothetical protein